MFCFSSSHSLKLLIFIALSTVILTGRCLCQPLQWTCPASTDNEATYFPNIAIDESSVANSVQGSPYLSGFYAYRFKPVVDESCNSIPRIEFCFEINTKNAKNNNIVLSILLGSIDSVAPDGTSFLARVFANAVISTPVNCDPELSSTKDNISVCCQSEQINVSLPTQTLQQINAFGIELPPDHIFLEYNDSENVVETFVGTGLDFHGALTDQQFRFPLQANGHFMNLSLRFLRFVIEQSPVQDSNTETVILGTVLPTVGGLITLSLLSITVLIIAIKRRKMKKMVLSKDPQKTFDNANYGDRVRVLHNRASNLERSSNSYYDYAVASNELDSSTRIVRAASYEQPLKSESGTYDEDIYVVPASDEPSLYGQFSQLKMHICSRDAISMKALLGSGQFGTVHKGEWMASEGGEKIEVAVKTLKEGASEEDKVKFLQEAAIMGQFSHPNVVKLYGIVIDGEPVMLILELLPEGDLLKVLHGIDPRSIDADLPHTLLSYCRQVASGMGYLAVKSFVHRDLAARNILMSEDGVCKIADFGMSRDLADENYYRSHGGKIPVKWTAPEALHYKKYSTASDVWSFGCVTYEIWSLGHKPFEVCTNVDCIKIVDKGIRLAPPPGCPKFIYKLMIDCWHPDPSSRPDFVSVAQQLSLPDTKLLKWSEEDKASDPEAATLGAGLDKAVDLYMDLQKQYNLHSV